MKYARDEMHIELVCCPDSWRWYLIGPNREEIEEGVSGIFQHACDDALLAFDEHLDGFDGFMPGV